MVYTPATKHPNGLRLLALDGGGVRGIVALVSLRELMKRVAQRDGLKEIPRPADYFDLAAGTSTGGIIGIMLFRLRMTVEDTINEYYKIGADVFCPKVYGYNIGKYLPVSMASFVNNSKNLVQDSRFDDADLNKAIDSVVAKYGLDENDRKLKGQAPLLHPGAARTFCCTTAQNKTETVLLRTYEPQVVNEKHYKQSAAHRIMKYNTNELTISLAARATSAAPTFFPEVKHPKLETLIASDKKSKAPINDVKTLAIQRQLVFWDGGLLNNNPIDQLWYARYELVQHNDPVPPISCVISLGTGYIESDSPASSWFHLTGVASVVMDFSTNTNAKSKDFTRHFIRLKARDEHSKSQYVRFSPKLVDKIGLADYTRMRDLEKLTQDYLDNKKTLEWLDRAVCAMCCSGCDKCEESI